MAGAARPGTAADGADIWTLLPQLDSIGVANYVVNDAGHAGHWWQAHHDVLTDFCQAARHSVTAGSGLSALRTSMVLRTSFRPD